MFVEDKGVDVLGVNFQFLCQQVMQVGGIQLDVGVQYLVVWQVGKLLYLSGDDVVGVGGYQKDVVKFVGYYCWYNVFYNFCGGGQFIQLVLVGVQCVVGDGDYCDIDIGVVVGFVGGDGYYFWQVGCGVVQVLSVGFSVLLVKVDEDQFFVNVLVEQGVGC